MNIPTRDMYLKSYSWCCSPLKAFIAILLLFPPRPILVWVSRTFTYQPDLEYIHASRRRSATAAAAAYSQYLAFYKTQGTLDMLIFRSAVPIVEIWESLCQCTEFPAGRKIVFVASLLLKSFAILAHQNVHGFITLFLRFFRVCRLQWNSTKW